MELASISTINSWIVGGLAIFVNLFFLYMVRFKSSGSLGQYRYMLMMSALFDIAQSIVALITSPTISDIAGDKAFIVVKGGIQVDFYYGRLFLLMFMILICQSIITPPCLFACRYLQVCRPHVFQSKVRFAIAAIPISISILTAVLAGLCLWPTESEIDYYSPYAMTVNLKRKAAFLVATFRDRKGFEYESSHDLRVFLTHVFLILLLFLSVLALLVMAFCWYSIVRVVRLRTFSARILAVQQRLHLILLFQFAVPFIFIHVPFYFSCFAPLLNIQTGNLAIIMPFLLTYSPLINPIPVMFFMSEYRNYIIEIFLYFR